VRRLLFVAGAAAATALVLAIGARPAAAATTTTLCSAHRPLTDPGENYYTPGCSGHDEPELDPLSGTPGSGKNLTWKFILPADGSYPVGATGPAFWFGGVVRDPESAFAQAFLEVQFYPDSAVSKCSKNGGANLTYAPNTYSVCSPVWSIVGDSEPAAFNAMLTTGPGSPMLMHAGDSITARFFVTSAHDGWHITIRDLTTKQQGTIVLNSPTAGPLNPPFDKAKIGNTLGWGLVHDGPVSFVWEIGHAYAYGPHPYRFCLPGQSICDSYNAASWAGTTPLRITGVTFGDGSKPEHWAVVSDYGGTAEVNASCKVYGTPYCIYPWFSRGHDGFRYGVDFPGTTRNYGQASQFQQQTLCGGPYGPRSTYCMTQIS